MSFGRAIADANPSETYAIIKHGEKGTNLVYQWNPTYGPSYTTFKGTVADGITALQAAGYSTEVVGMLWMQGESDAFNTTAAAYQTNLTAFIEDVRNNYGSNLPFVIGEITRSYILNGVDYTAWMTMIADAQTAIGETDPYSEFVSTTDLVFFDGIHFDANSTVTLGERFASAFLNLTGITNPEPEPDTDPTF